jgi:hypothetical protein
VNIILPTECVCVFPVVITSSECFHSVTYLVFVIETQFGLCAVGIEFSIRYYLDELQV